MQFTHEVQLQYQIDVQTVVMRSDAAGFGLRGVMFSEFIYVNFGKEDGSRGSALALGVLMMWSAEGVQNQHEVESDRSPERYIFLICIETVIKRFSNFIFDFDFSLLWLMQDSK